MFPFLFFFFLGFLGETALAPAAPGPFPPRSRTHTLAQRCVRHAEPAQGRPGATARRGDGGGGAREKLGTLLAQELRRWGRRCRLHPSPGHGGRHRRRARRGGEVALPQSQPRPRPQPRAWAPPLHRPRVRTQTFFRFGVRSTDAPAPLLRWWKRECTIAATRTGSASGSASAPARAAWTGAWTGPHASFAEQEHELRRQQRQWWRK